LIRDLHNIDVAKEFYEDRYEKGYMEEWDDLKKNKVKEVLSNLQLPLKGKALDFGCGNGVFTRIIKDILPNWEVYGVEISSTAVQNARKRIPDCVFFEASDSNKYKHQFDFLFSHHVIEHVQDLEETFETINEYLKPNSYQLHILPCGNEGSYEYEISKLMKNGIDPKIENRFFFEEPGHLRRLTSEDFSVHEKKIGFKLEREFYSNQQYGAINWITKSSPRFVKRLTNSNDAIDENTSKKIKALRQKLLPITYFQFPYSKYKQIKGKWHKTIIDRLKILILFIPAIISKPYYNYWDKKAAEEWQKNKSLRNGSEMFLFFAR
jgi:SAM-dependent methyltransferase